MAYDQRALVGVGGWLAFFVITLGLSAIATVVHAIALALSIDTAVPPQMAGGWHAYVAIMTSVALVQAAAYGYAAWRLNAKTDRDTPRVVIMVLWTLAIVPPLLDVIVAVLLLGLGGARAGTVLAGATLRPLIYAGIWTAYLIRSQRVANTYRDFDDEAPAVSGE